MRETAIPFVKRRAATRVEELLADEAVLVISGPRTVGKSLLLAEIARSRVLRSTTLTTA